MNKKLIVALATGLISSGAFAAACSGAVPMTASGTASTGNAAGEVCVCNGNGAGKTEVMGGSGTPVTASIAFIKSGFDMQCSSSTFVSFNEFSTTLIGVAAGSAKGNQTVRGNSNGGAIKVSDKCEGTNNNCTAADITTAIGLSSS